MGLDKQISSICSSVAFSLSTSTRSITGREIGIDMKNKITAISNPIIIAVMFNFFIL